MPTKTLASHGDASDAGACTAEDSRIVRRASEGGKLNVALVMGSPMNSFNLENQQLL